MALAQEFGIERLGFFTLTFADLVLDLKEANRRFDSLNSNVIKGRYRRAVVVPERQKSGRVHFHLLVVLDADIRTGADFEAFENRDYRSANKALRSEWAFWRLTAPRYGFGRHELLPVKSNAEGIARYVGKYICKHVRERVGSDKGARLVRYLGYGPGDRKASSRLAWNTDNAWVWRQKVRAFASRVGARDTADLQRLYGSHWAYHLQAVILAEAVAGPFPSDAASMTALAGELIYGRLPEVGLQRMQAVRYAERARKPVPSRFDGETISSLTAWARLKSIEILEGWPRVTWPVRPEDYKATDILDARMRSRSSVASRAETGLVVSKTPL
jgi:hypothetical protein